MFSRLIHYFLVHSRISDQIWDSIVLALIGFCGSLLHGLPVTFLVTIFLHDGYILHILSETFGKLGEFIPWQGGLHDFSQ